MAHDCICVAELYCRCEYCMDSPRDTSLAISLEGHDFDPISEAEFQQKNGRGSGALLPTLYAGADKKSASKR